MNDEKTSRRLIPPILVALIRLDPTAKSLAESWLVTHAGSDQVRREVDLAKCTGDRAMVLGALGRTSVETDWLARHILDGIDFELARYDSAIGYVPAAREGNPSVNIEYWFETLGRYGPAARAALPRLKKYLDHPSPFIRLWASEAISKISTPDRGSGNAEPRH